jgi:hypothetical protein|tara:strand:- start:38 stop:619 length:582 start_codon:yes stop_codon:yes gene_type:complete
MIVRYGTLKDLSYIDYLQKKNAEELSFYPNIVFERELEKKRILLAEINNQPCGYLYHGAEKTFCKIHQACIEYDLRGQLYGAKLVRDLITHCINKNVLSITLRCGSDIQANFFWKAMGFYCESITQGGVRRMRDINNWRYDIVKPLFITEFLPSEKKQDSSHWRKRKISIGSSFKRGKELLIYRKKVLQDAKQ